jgi:hypothetical protein
MKKYLLLLLPLTVVLNSCKKTVFHTIAHTNSNPSANYQPLTAGSSWTYRSDFSSFGLGIDTTITVMSAKTSTISGKVYQQAYSHAPASPSVLDTGYYYVNSHDYSMLQTISLTAGGNSIEYNFDMLYLKDNLAVGATWNVTTSALKLNGKIVEKGISKVVAGKTYTNVIHSNIVVNINYLSTNGFVTGSMNYDMYFAQGIGTVRTEISDLTDPQAAVIAQDLIAYTIK